MQFSVLVVVAVVMAGVVVLAMAAPIVAHVSDTTLPL